MLRWPNGKGIRFKPCDFLVRIQGGVQNPNHFVKRWAAYSP